MALAVIPYCLARAASEIGKNDRVAYPTGDGARTIPTKAIVDNAEPGEEPVTGWQCQQCGRVNSDVRRECKRCETIRPA
jgi:hypothetical protein